MDRSRLRNVILLLVISVTGCRKGPPEAAGDRHSAPEALATVGDRKITQTDVDLELQGMDPQLRSRYETEAGRRDVERSVIDRTVLAYEAKLQGIDRQPEIRKQIDGILSRKLLESETDKRFTGAEAERIYKANADKFKSEKIHLAQILVRIKADDGVNGEKKAKSKADKLLTQLKSGASFEQLARTYSDDQVSAARGGDLGEVTPGRLPPPLDDASRKLPAGGLSDVLQTPMGFHIVKAIEPLKTQTRPIDDVKPLLKTMFENEVSRTLLSELRTKYRVPENDGKRE